MGGAVTKEKKPQRTKGKSSGQNGVMDQKQSKNRKTTIQRDTWGEKRRGIRDGENTALGGDHEIVL